MPEIIDWPLLLLTTFLVPEVSSVKVFCMGRRVTWLFYRVSYRFYLLRFSRGVGIYWRDSSSFSLLPFSKRVNKNRGWCFRAICKVDSYRNCGDVCLSYLCQYRDGFRNAASSRIALTFLKLWGFLPSYLLDCGWHCAQYQKKRNDVLI